MIVHERPADLRSDARIAALASAAAVGVMAVVALGWPLTARPLVSVATAVLGGAFGLTLVREVARSSRRTTGSPFDPQVGVERDPVPAELVRLTGACEEVGTEPVAMPGLVGERLRASAMRRLRDRVGSEIQTEDDWRRVQRTVSPTLYRLVAGRGEDLGVVHVPALVDEIERL